MPYISYEYYSENFGGSMSKDEFIKAEAHAESIIRYLTFHNGDIFAAENDDVKKAVCAAADVIHQQTSKGNCTGADVGGIKSVNNDGYSVTFSVEKTDGQTSEVFLQQKVNDAVSIYLAHTGWLSRLLR